MGRLSVFTAQLILIFPFAALYAVSILLWKPEFIVLSALAYSILSTSALIGRADAFDSIIKYALSMLLPLLCAWGFHLYDRILGPIEWPGIIREAHFWDYLSMHVGGTFGVFLALIIPFFIPQKLIDFVATKNMHTDKDTGPSGVFLLFAFSVFVWFGLGADYLEPDRHTDEAVFLAICWSMSSAMVYLFMAMFHSFKTNLINEI